MTRPESRKLDNEKLADDRGQTATEHYGGRSNEPVGVNTDKSSHPRRLDVDLVLERSVRKVTTEIAE